MSLSIRAARPDESHVVAEVFLRSWKALMPFIPLGHTDEEVRAWIRHSVMLQKEVLVAVDGAEVVAMMAISEDEGGGWIDHLYVAPEQVGRGLGTALVEEALRRLRRPVRLYTFEANAPARRFYEARGFQAVEFGSSNEHGLPDVLYRHDGAPFTKNKS
jgi:GNAT superfamily N-acetyltransferase